jgi:hypothetical protein
MVIDGVVIDGKYDNTLGFGVSRIVKVALPVASANPADANISTNNRSIKNNNMNGNNTKNHANAVQLILHK